jgi:NDP-sugar pyrophosphorylase family protein
MSASEAPLASLPVAILCGGRGARLRPATDTMPKALIPLSGRPILDHVLDRYIVQGITRFVLCVGYRGDEVRARYEGKRPGVGIEISDLGETASMLARVVAVRDRAQPRLAVSYGDTFTSLDVAKMVHSHVTRKALATIVTAPIQSPFGLVTYDDEDRVTSFHEKPVLHYYIGHFLLEREALDYATPEMIAKPDGEGLVELFQRLAGEHRLARFEHQGLQITFNTESELRKAEEELGRFYTLVEKPWER